jgi:hypothetical protein
MEKQRMGTGGKFYRAGLLKTPDNKIVYIHPFIDGTITDFTSNISHKEHKEEGKWFLFDILE